MNSLSAREQKKEEIKKSRAGSITEGVIWKQLLLFFFPILFGTFFQQLYNTVDAIIVGRFVEMCIRDSVCSSFEKPISEKCRHPYGPTEYGWKRRSIKYICCNSRARGS